MQIDLAEAQRRVQSRITTPWMDLSEEAVVERLGRGERLADFDRLLIDWTEVRLLVRQVTDILRRHDALDAEDAARLHDLGRDGRLPALARRWFEATNGEPALADVPEMLDEVLRWALRPFLVRTAEVLQQRTNFEGWRRGSCPVCGGQPELGVIMPSGERHLACGRCQARWAFPAIACPFCGETARDQLVSFATPDGTYRVTACRTCQRYVKSLDGRRAHRPLLPALDAIATLPLDAVVMQKGFSNG